LSGSLLSSNQVFLRIEGGSTYAVGSFDGTNFHKATFAVPAGDLGGGKWIHLAGTYDGSHWTLYRNGTQVASAADSLGAVPVPYGEWAVGSGGEGWAQNFTGGIDEVAIYNTALSAARIQAHYAAATTAANPSLAISLSGGKVSLTWTGGVLQQSNVVTGPYTDVPGAASPYPVTISSKASFYKLR
jgi:hypothetical protein